MKFDVQILPYPILTVTPCVGVWIEIKDGDLDIEDASHSLRGSVD